MSHSPNTHLYVCSTNRETNGLIAIEEVPYIHEDHYIYKYDGNPHGIHMLQVYSHG